MAALEHRHWSFEGDPLKAARLVVTYSGSGSPVPITLASYQVSASADDAQEGRVAFTNITVWTDGVTVRLRNNTNAGLGVPVDFDSRT